MDTLENLKFPLNISVNLQKAYSVDLTMKMLL